MFNFALLLQPKAEKGRVEGTESSNEVGMGRAGPSASAHLLSSRVQAHRKVTKPFLRPLEEPLAPETLGVDERQALGILAGCCACHGAVTGHACVQAPSQGRWCFCFLGKRNSF